MSVSDLMTSLFVHLYSHSLPWSANLNIHYPPGPPSVQPLSCGLLIFTPIMQLVNPVAFLTLISFVAAQITVPSDPFARVHCNELAETRACCRPKRLQVGINGKNTKGHQCVAGVY